MARGEPGLRRGQGRSGDYAFFWKRPSWRVIRSDLIAIDPAKTYALNGFFKSAGEASTKVTFGLLMSDAKKRVLKRWNVFSVKGTRTELAAPCGTNDTALKVKDASAWKAGAKFVAAFGREENELNFDVTPRGIAAVKPEGDHWRIILKKPCGRAFPTGTPVVENKTGDNGIFYAFNTDIPAEWTELKGRIGPKQWWPGTAFVSVYILPQSAGVGKLLIDDLALREIESKP